MIRRVVYAAALTTRIISWQIVGPLPAHPMIVARRIIGALSADTAAVSGGTGEGAAIGGRSS